MPLDPTADKTADKTAETAPDKGAEGESQGPKYMTAEEFNRAQSSREKRLREQIKKDLAEMLAKSPAPKAAEADDGDEGEDEGKPAEGAKGDKPQAPADATAAELKRLRKRLEASEREREAEKKAREEQAAKAARDEERSKLSEALVAAGADAKRVRAAVALLHTEDRKVRRNAEGRIVFLADEDDEQDLPAGVKAWLGTDEGKAFLPTRGAEGSGSTAPKAPVAKGGKDARSVGKAALWAAVTGQKI
jgi:hypothetical protein